MTIGKHFPLNASKGSIRSQRRLTAILRHRGVEMTETTDGHPKRQRGICFDSFCLNHYP
jgi:histidinol phosphatase-like PHP family hydrolase